MPSLSITVVLIAITCVVSVLAWQQPALLSRLVLSPLAVRQRHEWYRLLSYGFVHADGMHLLFNMFTLYFFGTLIEQVTSERLGPVGYAGFYLSALLVAILPSYLRHRDDPRYSSLGASGAVSAMLFASILIAPWNLIYVFFVPMPAIVFAVAYVAYSVWAGRRGRDNFNHSAHLWGAGYGVLFLVLLEPRVVGYFLEQLANPDFSR